MDGLSVDVGVPFGSGGGEVIEIFSGGDYSAEFILRAYSATEASGMLTVTHADSDCTVSVTFNMTYQGS